eukprot:TRINITY_DN23740_c0_g1_i2.p1 TRINITY_DN23740_c0_g1~~TRINITY_DN23740_c0_g1_i2.p1  ORF type:complete len:139 (+),score=17.54 TRINITY_DN23740_c0_g1_i2:136-552(+)
MIRRPPRSTLSSSSAASDVYKRQLQKSIQLHHHHQSPSQNQIQFNHSKPLRLKPEIRQQVWSQYRSQPPGRQVKILPQFACRPTLVLSLIHISEPTRLLSISYAVFCLKKKKLTAMKHELHLLQYNTLHKEITRQCNI